MQKLPELKEKFKGLIKPYIDTGKYVLDPKHAEALVDLYYYMSKEVKFSDSGVAGRFFMDLGVDLNLVNLQFIQETGLNWPNCLIGRNKTLNCSMTIDQLVGHGSNTTWLSGNSFEDHDLARLNGDNDDIRNYSTKVETIISREKLFLKAKGEKTTTLKKMFIEDGEVIIRDVKEQLDYNDPDVITRLPHYGIELEVIPKAEAPARIVKDIIRDLDGHVIVKRDASLECSGGVSGFEIVSTPATFKAHKGLWKEFFENSAQHLRSWNTSKCGLHIHVSRRAFLKPHLGRFVMFINHPATRDFITELAGRNSGQWSKFQPVSLKDILKDQFMGRGGSRHVAVNLGNSETIEVRIFRGNVKKAGFFKCLEFVDALFNYTRHCSNSSMSVQLFLEWLKTNDYGYGNLTKWLKAHGYYNTEVKTNWREDECA